MVMINCPECEREVSDKAILCPNCGVLLALPAVRPEKVHWLSLILSIIGLVFSIILPIVAYPCLIVGLVQAVKKKTAYKTSAALVMCIIGLVIAIANSAIGAYMGVISIMSWQ